MARGGACDYQHAGSALDAIRQARGPNVQIRTGKKPGLYEVLDWAGSREMAAPLCTRAGGRAYTVNAGRISAPVACPG